MSEQGNFVGGFLVGTVVGGLVGGVLGVLVASRLSQSEPTDEEKRLTGLENKSNKGNKKRQIKASTDQSIEVARRGLEDKIAQLNEAIDDVRQQLGTVNGTVRAKEGQERTPAQDS